MLKRVFFVLFIVFVVLGLPTLRAQVSEETSKRVAEQLDLVPTVQQTLSELMKKNTTVMLAQQAIDRKDYAKAETLLRDVAYHQGEALNSLVWYMLFYCAYQQDPNRDDLMLYLHEASCHTSPEFLERLNKYYFGGKP